MPKHVDSGRRNRDDDDPWDPYFQWVPASKLMKTSVVSTTYLAPASPHLMWVLPSTLSFSWKKEMSLPIDDKLPILSLDCGITCYGIILEHVDHVAGSGWRDHWWDNIHLARIKASWWPGTQYSQIHLLWPSWLCLRDVASIAQEDSAICQRRKNKDPHFLNNYEIVKLRSTSGFKVCM